MCLEGNTTSKAGTGLQYDIGGLKMFIEHHIKRGKGRVNGRDVSQLTSTVSVNANMDSSYGSFRAILLVKDRALVSFWVLFTTIFSNSFNNRAEQDFKLFKGSSFYIKYFK